jgi:hypothetical protein
MVADSLEYRFYESTSGEQAYVQATGGIADVEIWYGGIEKGDPEWRKAIEQLGLGGWARRWLSKRPKVSRNA